ncbi:DUF3784 domain-containing protein (plasmid) [Paraclostridium ghonii]|uniref:DUF3784 domain-containing protein n=1 Tax=Paraclostridium ghonii TaxID=29358 RepID=UPI00202CE8DF|nr:DUF3784 domain-containing protein [Paeniclostridium ghonii]MCM0165815.1 DUF3784 domain-containing protein [Paeniclostridium ghonii]
MFFSCLIMSLIFFIVAFIFFIFKNKSCILISGYNFIPKDQRKNYDETKLSKDFGTTFFKYGLIFFLGGIGCIMISSWCFWISFAIWLIYFLRNTSFSNKIFDKYKIN